MSPCWAFHFLMFQMLSFGPIFCALKSLVPWSSHTCHNSDTQSLLADLAPSLFCDTRHFTAVTSIPHGLYSPAHSIRP